VQIKMKGYYHYLIVLIHCIWFSILGCTLPDQSAKTHGRGFITTPSNYYSTPKARSLADRYKQNLDRIVERIVKTPKTSTLQFANNLASVGGIGFFTHSATKTNDERYLEVVLGVPDTFSGKGEQNQKFAQLFALYGHELLAILINDAAIYQETEVVGYGLNFSWRSVVSEGAASRVILERAIVYAAKDKVRSYLRQEINSDRLLGEAVIFAGEENAPLKLVSYHRPEPTPHYNPAVREETIIAKSEPPMITPKGAVPTERSTRRAEALKNKRVPSSVENPVASQQKADEFPASPPPVNGLTSEEKAKSAEERVRSAQQNQSAPTKDQAVNESAPSAPNNAIGEPATIKPTVTKEKPAESAVVKIPESAVKPAFEQSQSSGVPLVDSKAEAGSPQPARAAEKARTEEVVANKSAGPKATNSKSDELPSSLAEQRYKPSAKSGGTVLIKPPSEPSKSPSAAVEDPKDNQRPAKEEVALKSASKSDPLRPMVPRALEGYIVQLTFEEKNEAQRWAETLERRGHAVSVTVPAGGGTIRVRIGSFSQREDAERQLQRLRQDGLSGIVLNLPQAYRPAVQPTPGESVTKTGATMQ
jgi:cell division protein FtsN